MKAGPNCSCRNINNWAVLSVYIEISKISVECPLFPLGTHLSKMVVLLRLCYERKSINHVSWGAVIDCVAYLKRLKEAYRVLNIEDAYYKRVYLVGFPEQLDYIRLLY